MVKLTQTALFCEIENNTSKKMQGLNPTSRLLARTIFIPIGVVRLPLPGALTHLLHVRLGTWTWENSVGKSCKPERNCLTRNMYSVSFKPRFVCQPKSAFAWILVEESVVHDHRTISLLQQMWARQTCAQDVNPTFEASAMTVPRSPALLSTICTDQSCAIAILQSWSILRTNNLEQEQIRKILEMETLKAPCKLSSYHLLPSQLRKSCSTPSKTTTPSYNQHEIGCLSPQRLLPYRGPQKCRRKHV